MNARRASVVMLLAVLGALPGSASPAAGVQWKHPAGIVTEETIAEVREKLANQPWAREVYRNRKAALERWILVSSEDLRRVFPRKRGNVYHNFSCPHDRQRLEFDPFESRQFKCPLCGAVYAPGTDAGIYPPGDKYHGTMYDGWACLFYQEAADVAADLALIGRIEGREAQANRGIEIILLYADTIERLKTDVQVDRQFSRILTYHREGDNKVLNDLARAYELLRDRMTPEQRARFERAALRRLLDDIMMERIYTQNHNNLYQWHRTIVQTGLALEREDLIDWSFGYGPWSPEREPEHRSIRRLAATHFKEDGAYWEMCSGYHLYPLHAFCEFAVLSRSVSAMDPARFPADRYDLTSGACPMGEAIGRGLHWFLSMAMPDRTMPTVGDSMAPRAGLTDYYTTAEVGYRYYGLKAIGDGPALRQGKRTWYGLLCGSPEITQSPQPFTSSYLTSGWVSLRNDCRGNRAWVGLNALIPGGGHQHADRLTLLMYSQGQLLALEKATPYNESTTRVLGTLSQSHNTVTVGRTSQDQGEALKNEQLPQVAYFFDGPAAKYAELHADRLYPQTTAYRRSVALIEDVCVDLFRVQGGASYDWIVHHAGSAPEFSIPMASGGSFAPKEWLHGGTSHVRSSKTDGAWEARWKVEEVTSRLSMARADGTEVFALETYPVDNAVVTPKNPPCQSLVVRRFNDDPFLAVWDAWRDVSNLKEVSPGDTPQSLSLKTAAGRYALLFGPGTARFESGMSITTDAAFTLWRDPDAVMFVRGTSVAIACPEGQLEIAVQQPATVSVEFAGGTATIETAGDIQYETVRGIDRSRPASPIDVAIRGNLWQVVDRKRIPGP